MNSQKQTAKSQPEKKNGHTSEPAGVLAQRELFTEAGERSTGLLGVESNRSFQTQARRLFDSRFPKAQRQDLASEIGNIHGNNHLAKLINEPTLRNPVASRIGRILQRQDTAGENTAKRAMAEEILADIEAGGITVAVYAFHGVNQAAEFQRQATQYAQDHRAIGFRGNTVGEGVAMEITPTLPAVLNSLNTKINALLASFPDLAWDESGVIPIRTLAIFTHGQRTGLQARTQGQWVYMQQLEAWVQSISPFLAPSPMIPLFACSTAGEPPAGVPFAEAMQLALEMALEAQYGPETEVEPEVWGHTTSGHTTGNVLLAQISGSVNTRLLSELGHRLARLAIERAGRTGTLNSTQQAEVEDEGTQALARVLRVPDTRTGARDPLNVYAREIPHMGIGRVWHDLSTQGTPNLADLELTPEAQARAAQGLLEFQGRFASELAALLQKVNALPVEPSLEQSTITEELD